uniref:Uncharacterized protein n=1 Tax=Bombyx mori TaxID=7091 RepID=A0A8R2AU39_BOMMO|nr:uncharacterized protein LOC101738127 [Bombyx mori]
MLREYYKILIILQLIIIVSESRKVKIETSHPPRDYRPSKWLSNSAMDMWFGNKSIVEIIGREFADVVNRFASRRARDVLIQKYSNQESTINNYSASNGTSHYV